MKILLILRQRSTSEVGRENVVTRTGTYLIVSNGHTSECIFATVLCMLTLRQAK